MPQSTQPARSAHLFTPKLVTALSEGYRWSTFQRDLLAGLTVAIVALPLSMALAIASNTPPERGLYTAIVAGFLISALGGSRFQVGGPTGAFVVVVFNIVDAHGYEGLVIATLMAGAMLVLAGVARLGTYIKYIPHPVIIGFTSGIAVIIFSSQVGEILGLDLTDMPGAFLDKWQAFFAARQTIDPASLGLALGSLGLIVALRCLRPAWPGFLIAIVLGAVAVPALGLAVDTVGSRFGGIPRMLPAPNLPPALSTAQVVALMPSAFTIFLLAGIESLLSAVVADGMTGRRHRSNCELVAQGIANMASAVMGGIPATGAIARTATNIRAGAATPVAGMLHALFVLAMMVGLAPLAIYIPMPVLGAILIIVAWNMSEVRQFRHLLRAPPGERLVLLATFGLTVLVDLTVAIEVGIVLAAIMFMHRMAEAVELSTEATLIEVDIDDEGRDRARVVDRAALPPGVEVYDLKGPFFFGAAATLHNVLARIGRPPRVFILRMRLVPLIDSSGAHALRSFVQDLHRRGTRVILTGVQPGPLDAIRSLDLEVEIAPTLEGALAAAGLAAGAEKDVGEGTAHP